MEAHFQADIDAIQNIAGLPATLETVCDVTGMGFAAVARVTPDRWIACAVRDQIDFGLRPGGELKVETTLCDRIQKTNEFVVIDHVDNDPAYRGHPCPAMYGFQSYISVPITLAVGTFFGTLCAIDPQPRHLNTPHVVGMFSVFARLLGLQIDAIKGLDLAVEQFASPRSTRQAGPMDAILGHLLLALSVAKKEENVALCNAIELGLYLVDRDASRDSLGSS